MEPWQSWAIVGVVGFGAAYYYSTSGNKKRGRGLRNNPPPLNPQRGPKGRTNSRDKRKEREGGASDHAASDVADVSSTSVPTDDHDGVKNRKRGKKLQPSKLAQSSAVDVGNEQGIDVNDIGMGEGMDNDEFAKRFSSVRTGASLKKPAATEDKKARKQKRRSKAFSEDANGNTFKVDGGTMSHDLSTASSTTGADADDDRSSANSPSFGATQAITPSGADVSDMLEAPAKGPSVLRLTEPANPQPPRQPKAQKAAQEPETKKQRQRRQKKEEEKVLREQIEKERLVALEKQRRTVREAEGRPPKNGLGLSQVPSMNAWSKPAGAAKENSTPSPAQHADLLDTFEETTTPNSQHQANKTNGVVADQKAWNNELPSEEEQMRLLSEMDSDNAWNTVQKGGKGKKKSAANSPAVDSVTSFGANEKKSVPSTKTSGASANVTAEKPSITSSHLMGDSEDQTETATSVGGASTEKSTGHVKATKDTIDHSVWNRSNIHDHPDYDPLYPYALTGHPEDSDWAVV